MKSFKEEFSKIEAQVSNNSPHRQALERIKSRGSDKPLILYGAGWLCEEIITHCAAAGLEITCICDTYKAGVYGRSGLAIISPAELKERYFDATIIIASFEYEKEIANYLKELGFPDSQIQPCPIPHQHMISPPDFVEHHLAGYEWAYDFFKDEVSKAIIIDRIKLHLLGIPINRTSAAVTYFEPGVIDLLPEEVFIDGGCLTGDTVEELDRQLKSKGLNGWKHVYSFEPDAAVFETAARTLQKYDNIDLIAKGLWSCEAELTFYSKGGDGSSSFIAGTDGVMVPVVSLDGFFAGMPEDELPTFIKMDIEGAEKQALLGAERIIKTKLPKLAICVYHKPEDIYELPQLIHGFNPDYKLTLAQCIDGLYDTVLYAV